MRQSYGMHQAQRQQMRASPSLIQFAEILQLSSQELQHMILHEAAANPALELHEQAVCPRCGERLLAGGACLRCRSAPEREMDRAQLRERLSAAERDAAEIDDEERDVFRTVADQRSLHEHLLDELAVVLEENAVPIGEQLVGELDERGFLEPDVTERVAGTLGVPETGVASVLSALQSVGPLGVGARSVQECLNLQLRRWEDLGETHPLARILVAGHLDDLAHGRFGRIAEQLGVDQAEVLAGRDFIRTHLRPYPIAERTDLAPWERQTGTGELAPDVVIRHAKDGRLTVEVVESRRYSLSIDPLYDRLVAELDAAGDAGSAREQGNSQAHPEQEPGRAGTEDRADQTNRSASADTSPTKERSAMDGVRLTRGEQEHVHDHVERARQFLNHIRERRSTMRRVTEYVVKRQAAFLERGPRYIEPLTRAEVAEALDLHESTISRATAGKYAMLPNRQVVPFSLFFKASLSVQDVLRELVENETNPLSDAKLAEMLAARGYPIARRTVAKYRRELGIPASSVR